MHGRVRSDKVSAVETHVRTTQLPNSDIEVSVLAMGCWALAGGKEWGPQSALDAVGAVGAALDAGINFLDTAPAYGDGDSERLLGEALRGKRHQAVIATKVSADDLASDRVVASVERSLRNLNTDFIDLLQVHWPNRNVPLHETWAAFERLKTQGKVRSLGVSNFGVHDLGDVCALGHPSTNQIPYSLLWRAIEFDLLPACRQRDVGVLCYNPLLAGLLTGKFSSAAAVPDGRARSRHFAGTRALARHGEAGCELETFLALTELKQLAQRLGQPLANTALAWLLHQPGVTSVIVGLRNHEQALANALATELVLDAAILSALNAITAALKTRLGKNPDLWQGRDESRYR